MSKDKISDYSPSADSNTDVGGIGIKGSDPVHNMDNGLREIMSHLADMNAGTSPISDAFSIGAPSDEFSGLDKQVRFDVSDVTKGIKRVLKVPDTDGALVVSDEDGALVVSDSEGNAVGIDAALLDGLPSSHYLDASNLNAGIIPVERLPNVTSGLTQTALDDKADVTALSALLSKDAPQILTDVQKKQVLANLGLVNNRAVNHVNTPHYYAASTDRHIDVLDTSIVTSTASSKVLIQVQISFERSSAGVFYLRRNGIEIDPDLSGEARYVGLVPIPYDENEESTMAHANFFYEDEPGLIGAHTYEIWVLGNDNPLGLNRTLTDANSSSYERATSTVMLTESL